jgi:hypothetical protein
MQPTSIPLRRVPLIVVSLLTAVLLATTLPAVLHGRIQTADPRAAIPSLTETPFDEPASRILGGLDGWREAPEYVRLFAPAAHASQYRAFVSSQPLDAVVPRIAATAGHDAPGAWSVESLGPFDAFGPDGAYAPYALARLYTAGPAHVARGPHASSNGIDAWTLISPYPDAPLARLSTGTLLLILRVPPL